LPLYLEHDFHNRKLYENKADPKLPIGTKIEDFTVVDKVQNYFIGRTEKVRSVGWNPRLKLAEHTEFFTRARGQLCTVYHPHMKTLHVKYPFDIAYLTFRWRTADAANDR
jgi:hypothetical protein